MRLDHHYEPIAMIHEGGAVLGLDVADEDTRDHRVQQAFVETLKENHRLRLSIIDLDKQIAALSRSVQWRTLFIFVGFALGFMLCALLMAVSQ